VVVVFVLLDFGFVLLDFVFSGGKRALLASSFEPLEDSGVGVDRGIFGGLVGVEDPPVVGIVGIVEAGVLAVVPGAVVGVLAGVLASTLTGLWELPLNAA
jgi:hypothetical protein